ncbi:MAG: choice-of-anchor J domain-containing protein, partial [Thermoplasmata archaeon]|nr:choice-of-anchor J domain-containing protein [Thermoplasmata archaeon]
DTVNPGGSTEADIISTEIPLTDINPGWGTELNMCDPQNAIDWVNYVYTNYPADRYLWDMWNHGGSWLYGMCSDDTDGDDLTMLEVRSIYETLRTDNNKIKLFDVAGYDECLMSDVSNDYDEVPYIDYICNSEDSIAGDGWEYNLVLEPMAANPDMGGEEAAFHVFQAYVDFYGTSGGLTTMSIINSTMFYLDLIPAVNRLAQKGIHDITANRAALQTAANNAEDWQGYTWQKDLIHFCENIVAGLPANEISAAAQNVINIGQACPPGTQFGDPAWDGDRAIIIHNQNFNENGITIYAASPPYDNLYDTMTFTDTNWEEFYQVLWGSDADQPNTEPTVIIGSPSDGSFVTIDTTVVVSGTANDPDGTVQGVEVAIDTEHWLPAAGTNAWIFNWDNTGWEPGWHYISARSYDGQDYSDLDTITVEIIIDPDMPDLTLWTADIGFDNPTPNEGDMVNIDATVYNVGTVDSAVGVEIGFYDGPQIDGDLIGVVSASPGTIPAGNSSGWGQVAWDTSLEAGFHDIYVVADPNHTVPELTDANNTAVRPITVAGYNIDVDCLVNTSTVQAGFNYVYQINITNTGTMADTFNLVLNNPAGWNTILSDSSVTLNSLDWQIVTVTVEAPPTALPTEFAVVDVIGTSQGNPAITDSVETVTTVMPGIILINDGNAGIANYRTALDNNGYDYDEGTVTTDISPYQIVIWATDGMDPITEPAEEDKIAAFLDTGGSVYINGEDIGYDIGISNVGESAGFYRDYLHADYIADDSNGLSVDGIPGDPITDGISGFTITGSFPSSIVPYDANASQIFYYDSPGGAGIKVDTGSYRLVYIACEYFEGADLQANKDLLMDRIIQWLNTDKPPIVTVTNPNAQDTIQSGIIDITWMASDDIGLAVDPIYIDYSDDGGDTWDGLVSALPNTGSYLWDTTVHPDGVEYLIQIWAGDSIGQWSEDTSDYLFSVDNIPNDRWHLQIQSSEPGYLDLDMKPAEDAFQELGADITGIGQFRIGATTWLSDPMTEDVSISGTWNFQIYGMVDNPSADGNLYARVYSYDGVGLTPLFDSANDEEDVGSFIGVYHPFIWSHSAPASIVTTGDSIAVEIWLDASAGSGPAPGPNLATADIAVTGTVSGDYTDTMSQNDGYESIAEISGPVDITLLFEDFEEGGALPTDWDNTDFDAGGGNAAEAWWHTTTATEYSISGAGDYAMVSDSDNTGSGYDMWAWLKTPTFDSSGYTTVTLEFEHNYDWFGEIDPEGVYVYVASDGSVDAGDTEVYYHVGSDTSGILQLDITAACGGSSNVQIGWYYDANFDYYWAIDDVFVYSSVSTSIMEHKWTIDVPAGMNPYTFYLDAYRTPNAEGDDFVFAYSTDNNTFIDMLTVSAGSDTDTYQSFVLPSLSGIVYIRAMDTDRGSGNTNSDTLYIDHMYIESMVPSPRFYMAYDYGDAQSYIEPALSGSSPPATFDVPVALGWNFISDPLIPGDTSIPTIFTDLDGNTTWTMLKHYDGADLADHWKTYNPTYPGTPDLNNADETMGVWIYVDAVGDGIIRLEGSNPSATTINLVAGWNMVGFPSQVEGYTVGDLKTESGGLVTRVDRYNDAAAYDIEIMPDGDMFLRGDAYWVYSTGAYAWVIP